METGVWISLTAYFVLMLAIGFYAYGKSHARMIDNQRPVSEKLVILIR